MNFIPQIEKALRKASDEEKAAVVKELERLVGRFSPPSHTSNDYVTLSKGTLSVPSTIGVPTPLGQIRAIPVETLADVKDMFYWVASEKALYSKVANQLVRIPFPDVSNGRTDDARVNTIRCRYKSKKVCEKFRVGCTFAHDGDVYVKVGHPSKTEIPTLGTPSTFTEDVAATSAEDVRKLLFYGLSDLATATATIRAKKLGAGVHRHPTVCGVLPQGS